MTLSLASAALLLTPVGLTGQDDAAGEPGDRRAPQRTPQRTPLVLKAGTVHPVSGPAIENGVVVIRGGRIVAVGPAGEVEVPEGATVIEHPGAHAYPGLVDALATAFVDSTAAQPGGVDAGATLDNALDPFHRPSRALVEHGVTTAYVSNRAPVVWRGQGLLLRPQTDGYRRFGRGDAATAVGLHARLVVGDSHPLQQVQQLAGTANEFAQLEKYEEQFEKYEEQLEKYETSFAEYLDWHRERKAKDAGEESGEAEDDDAPQEGAESGAESGDKSGGKSGGDEQGGKQQGGKNGGQRRTGGRRGRGRSAPQDPAEGDGEQQGDSDEQDGDGDEKSAEKAPERPERPQEPARDPAKDALIAVRDGELRLFVEAVRPVEIRRALELVREHELRDAVLEIVRGAAPVASELARAGVRAVLLDGTPPGEQPYLEAADAARSPAAVLADAGVPIAFGSGDVRRARHLPAVAAEAVGHGLAPDLAVRALTLTAAEVLGVAEQIGSLEPGKRADLLVVSGPLLASDSRVLRVVSSGRTVHTAGADAGSAGAATGDDR